MIATCHADGCPYAGQPVDVGDATAVVCGGCQDTLTVEDTPAPKRKRPPAP